MHKVCHWEAGGRTGSARPLTRSSQQGFEMQSLQRVPRRQTIHSVSGTELLVFRGRVRQKSSPNSETRKGSTTRTQTIRLMASLFSHRSVRTSKGECDFAHTQQFSTCASPSQVGEQCDGSRYVSAQSHLRGMDGKSRRLDSAKGAANTPICVAGPRAPLRSFLDDPE